jgi:peroxin-6
MNLLSTGRTHSAKANGMVNGHHLPPSRIIRQGEILDSPTGGTSYRILMLEPVRQGTCNSSTTLIISTTPYIRSIQNEGYENDDHHSESSHPRTHLSLDDFDPDAFLSASLSLPQPIDIPDGGTLPTGPLSSLTNGSNTSGSITPRPGGIHSPVVPISDLSEDVDLNAHSSDSGIRFSAVRATGAGEGGDEVCWIGVGGLGRAGIFEGDWVYLSARGEGRLVKVLAWERLDIPDSELPSDPILIPPNLFRTIFPDPSSSSTEVVILPTPFGARTPTLPTAKTITIARVATTEGVDKRYEQSWLKGLRRHFANTEGEEGRLVRRGDVFSVPIWQDKPMVAEEDISDEEDSDDECRTKLKTPLSVAYFQITSLSFDPLVALEDDFGSSLSSKARAGELGVWADVGGDTRMVLTGLERSRVSGRGGDLAWWNICAYFRPSTSGLQWVNADNIASPPLPASLVATSKLRDLLSSCLSRPGMGSLLQLSILVQGARGSGKINLIRSLADELGYNVIQVSFSQNIANLRSTALILLATLSKPFKALYNPVSIKPNLPHLPYSFFTISRPWQRSPNQPRQAALHLLSR